MASISFENQVVIITGGGGGLGSAYAREIARRGGAVVVNDLGCSVPGEGSDTGAADTIADEIRRSGGRAVPSYATVATPEGAEEIAETAIREFGRVDALINSAGNMRFGPFENQSVEDLQSLLAVHLFGAFNMSKAIWPRMKAQGYGRIVFTSSGAGIYGNRMMAGYASAKAGVIGLMNVLAIEGEEHGIVSNAILPTAESKMTDYVGAGSKAREHNPTAAKMSRFMDPVYTAGVATFLASSACTSGGMLYSSVGGRVARVFAGVGNGWRRDDLAPVTSEDVAANFGVITELPEGAGFPRNMQDEFALVASRMGNSVQEGGWR